MFNYFGFSLGLGLRVFDLPWFVVLVGIASGGLGYYGVMFWFLR